GGNAPYMGLFIVLERDDQGTPSLEAYFMEGQTNYISKGGRDFSIGNKAPYTLLVQYIVPMLSARLGTLASVGLA
ncbi:MAG: hypothetical protein RR951_08170, partial [Ruthenibacterium sp.]